MRDTPLATGLSIGLGAGVGATARALVLLAVSPDSPQMLALAVTFAINLVACFAMGRFQPGPFWGMGFLGGFSTFSAVTLACAHTTPIDAAVIITLSLTVSVLAWFAGDALRGRKV